jgi:quercetin 2,3-dioxygenase
MKTVIHRAETRGEVDFGWLKSKHTFSFGQYHNPDRNNFGVLRVLNDDQVKGGAGFGTHPHKNMEIISIPLDGVMEHKDSMGNVVTIDSQTVQVMSAGTGISHSEYNKSKSDDLKFLQIWVIPKEHNVTPRYDEVKIDKAKMKNNFLQVLSPNETDDGVWIHQDAWFSLSEIETGKKVVYDLKNVTNGVYVFLLEGSIEINDLEINKRDGVGFWELDKLEINATKDSKALLMEVPMTM